MPAAGKALFGLDFYQICPYYACFALSCKAKCLVLWKKISSAAPLRGIWLRTHNWGIEREENSLEPVGNQTHDFKIFTQLKQLKSHVSCLAKKSLWKQRGVVQRTLPTVLKLLGNNVNKHQICVSIKTLLTCAIKKPFSYQLLRLFVYSNGWIQYFWIISPEMRMRGYK